LRMQAGAPLGPVLSWR